MVKTIAVKICVSIFSLIFFLGLLELGLRGIGYIYSRRRSRAQVSLFDLESGERPVPRTGDFRNIREVESPRRGRVPPDSEKLYTILCVGDSYTYGGLGGFDQTYPYQLQMMLNSGRTAEKVQVINGGVCEYNSRQVLKRLPALIQNFKPDALILLAGSTNKFNFALYDMRGRKILGIIRTFRVYKMLKIIYLNLRKRFFMWRQEESAKTSLSGDKSKVGRDGYPSVPPNWMRMAGYFKEMSMIDSPSKVGSHYEKVWFYYNTGKIQEALDLCREMLKADPDLIEIRCTMAFFYYQTGHIKEAAELYEEAYRRKPDSAFVLSHMSYFYNMLYRDEYKEGALDIKHCLKAIQFDPLYEHHHYYTLLHSFETQSKYDADYVFGFFQKMLEDDPGLAESKLFMNYYTFFREQEQLEGKIDEWLEQDLEAIVRLCRKNNIKVIVQNYPYPYAIANRALKDIAEKYSLPFVDNQAVFDKRVNEENRKEYFHDDDHCTTKGHRIMAENVYKVLISEEIVPGGSNGYG